MRKRLSRFAPPSRRFVVGLLLTATLPACGPPPADPPDHVILLTVDTWRADHFLSTGGGVFLTPNLEQLARSSVRFAANNSVGAVTSAGIAGLFTGLLPNRSGVIVNEHVLSPRLQTLTTKLHEAGFLTAGFVANPVVAPGSGFENGFDHYERVKQRHPFWKTKASQINQRALEWIDEQGTIEHLFLWLHYMEPHGPYEPTEDLTRLFSVESFDAPTVIPLLDEGKNSGWQGIPHYQRVGSGVSTNDGRVYLLRYAAEVLGLDRELGRILKALEVRGLLANSILVLAADHGEALAGDHGYYFSHDNGLTEDQIHVPLMISFPGCCPAGQVVERPTSNIDVLPTLLRLLAITPPEEIDGVDLMSDEPRHVLAESWQERSIRRKSFKLRWMHAENTFVLVDLSEDPGESVDLSASNPEIFHELKRKLREIRQRPQLAQPVVRGQPEPEQTRELRALGYVK